MRRRRIIYSPNELYIKGKRYLIFASAIPEQAKLISEYKLGEKSTYYQAFEPDKGIALIESNTEPLLLRVKQLGDAVKPLDPRAKFQKLKALSKSRDPELKDTATAAIDLIRRNFYQ
jgi:hypothetical protein